MSAGLAFSAGSAFAGGENDDTLSGVSSLSDTKCDGEDTTISNTAEVDLDDDFFSVDGEASGLGTSNDIVRITYFTDTLNKVSVSDKKGSIDQKEFSLLCVFINDIAVVNGGRDTLVAGVNNPICNFIDKCKVSGSVNVNLSNDKCSGKASANCSGDNIYSALTSDQVVSITAAFPKGNKCSVKFNPQPSGKKSSLNINLNNKNESCSPDFVD